MTSFNLFKNLLTVCACIWRGMYCTCLQRPGNKSCESALSLHLCVGSGVNLWLSDVWQVLQAAELWCWPTCVFNLHWDTRLLWQGYYFPPKSNGDKHDFRMPVFLRPSFWSWVIYRRMQRRAMPPHPGNCIVTPAHCTFTRTSCLSEF